MNQATTPRPLATGRLSKTPFPHLLLYLYEHRYSGTLTVQGPEQAEPTRVRFDHGFADGAASVAPADSLAMVLMPMCGLADGEYAFYQRDDLVGHSQDVILGHVDPYPFLARALRVHASDAAVETLLARYTDALLALQPGVDLRRFALRQDEREVADMLAREPYTLSDLERSSEVRPQRLRRLLYLLLITKAVVPHRVSTSGSATGPRFSNFPPPLASGRPPAAASPQSPAIPSESPAASDRSGVWDGLPQSGNAEGWQRLVRGTHRPPGVAHHPPSQHPSTVPPSLIPIPEPPPVPGTTPTLGSVYPPATLPPRAMHDALRPRSAPAPMPPLPAVESPHASTHRQSVPSPGAHIPGVVMPTSRPQPPELPAASRGTIPPAQGPDGMLPRVELLCERERYGEALGLLDHLVANFAGEARVHAMRAWVIFHQAAGEAVAPDALADALATALRLDSLQPRALYVAGLQRKREGRMVEAQRYFARACGLDTDALGADDEIRLAAERELRLLDMRRRGR